MVCGAYGASFGVSQVFHSVGPGAQRFGEGSSRKAREHWQLSLCCVVVLSSAEWPRTTPEYGQVPPARAIQELVTAWK